MIEIHIYLGSPIREEFELVVRDSSSIDAYLSALACLQPITDRFIIRGFTKIEPSELFHEGRETLKKSVDAMCEQGTLARCVEHSKHFRIISERKRDPE